MKKTYPKVPNHYHDSVPDAFYAASDLRLLEKVDGANFRIYLYDERYEDCYGEGLESYNPEDGDVFIGLKGTIRGRLSDPLESFDGNLPRVIRELRTVIEEDALYEQHTKYDTPLLLFGELMVKHTLDYGYSETPPPAFIGFDVFRLNTYEKAPSYPFDERFDGFLSFEEMCAVFDAVGLETIAVVDAAATGTDPDNITIPVSEYGPVKAEGLVLRSDERDRRVKVVSKEFRERAKKAWGQRAKDTESGAEFFVARYLTNPRLRKTIRKRLNRQASDPLSPSRIASEAATDAWVEEMDEIQNIRINITPSNIHRFALDRAEEVIQTMETNSELNDSDLSELWTNYATEEADRDEPATSLYPGPETLEAAIEAVVEAENREREFARALFSDSEIQHVAESLSGSEDVSVEHIPEVSDRFIELFLYEEIGIVASLPLPIKIPEVTQEITAHVREVLTPEDYEQGSTWEPELGDDELETYAELF